jgi:hypothetical protein
VARIDHRDVLTRYLANEHVETLGAAMRSLPATIDVELVANVVVQMTRRTHIIGKQCKAIPAGVIRNVLAREVPGAMHLFVRLAVPAELDDEQLCKAWQRALDTLLDLDTSYGWGSKQRKVKIAAVAADAAMLAAVQGTVAHAATVPVDMLAVLAADGGAASYDALVTHIDAAFTAGDSRLDMLRRLRTHAAATPALARLFADIDGALAARNDASPALALGPIIGIGEVSMLAFSVRLSSTRTTDTHVPWAQGSIDVDSRDQIWLRVWLGTLDGRHLVTSFTSAGPERDGLELGPCAPADLPAWLAHAAETLDLEWEPFEVSQSNLRGKKRDLVARWLRRGTP